MSDLQPKTDEDLNRMLAEMLGWKFLTFEGRHTITDPSGQKLTCGIDSLSMNQFAHMILESYCADLNAVAKVEAGLDGFASDLYANILVNLLNPHRIDDYDPERDGAPTLAWPGVFQVVTATARQRTIALIQTLT